VVAGGASAAGNPAAVAVVRPGDVSALLLGIGPAAGALAAAGETTAASAMGAAWYPPWYPILLLVILLPASAAVGLGALSAVLPLAAAGSACSGVVTASAAAADAPANARPRIAMHSDSRARMDGPFKASPTRVDVRLWPV